ncbi:MAG: hypothetical protein Wins2KO_24170 [Winogradskyella sp.]
MKYIKTIIVLLLLASCNSKKAEEEVVKQDDTFKVLTNTVDEYVKNSLQRGNVNSFALAIYKDGKMYQNYYGELDKGAKNTPNENSLYEIASITKTLTGSLVAKSVIDGKINLDDDIRNYLDADYPNLEFEEQPITIRNLLTHSLGFKEKTPKRLKAFNEKMNTTQDINNVEVYTIEDLLEELKTAELDKAPGTVFVYNSVGPELLAYILEKVNKKPFKEQLNEFLGELNMNNTFLNESEKHLKDLVRGYSGDTLVPIDYCPVYGAAGGAISTLPDLATYMKYLVDNKEEPWVKEASRILFTDKEDDENLGYLWQNIDEADVEGYYYSKTGTSNGTQSGVLICPDSNYAIALIVNNTSEDAYNDWYTLFFRDIEPDVINYPKLNLFSKLKSGILNDSKEAISEYNTLKVDTTNYFTTSAVVLNNFGYELLSANKNAEAINLFEFATQQFPQNSNLFDSLGEVYFINEDYDKALENYKKALELNPKSENAKNYIEKIEKLFD